MSDFADEFDVPKEAPTDKLEQLSKMLEEVEQLSEAIEQIEAEGKAARAALYALVGHFSIPQEGRIPSLMMELGLEEITHNGKKVKIVSEIYGGLPKRDEAKRKAALEWLEAHEAGGLIKTDVSVQFGRESLEEAKALAERINRAGHPVQFNSDVNTQTLRAFARERLREGAEIDLEVLGLNVGKVSQIKAVKK